MIGCVYLALPWFRLWVMNVSSWPIATFRFATEFDRYRGIADMAGLGAGSSRSRMTQQRHLLRPTTVPSMPVLAYIKVIV
jgi:hypothetical protein